jgi:hypothetical protein
MTGVAIARGLTDLLNDICVTEGGIRRNDTRIWTDYLHKMTEDEWADLLAAMNAVNEDSPGCYYPSDLGTLMEAQEELRKAMLKGKSFVGRPNVARSGNKSLAWRTIMVMREIVNRYNGIHIPNRPGAIDDVKDLLADPHFNELFKEQA